MKSYLISAILFIIATIMLASCNKENSNTSNIEPEAEYTIMLYGCGGGNLDTYFNLNFKEVEAMGYQEDVQFTAMFKYSTSWQDMDELYEGTRLLTMGPSGEMSNTRVGDSDLRLDDPQNIANFIIDAKLRLPAKKYILIIGNHGEAFDIFDQPTESSYNTRAICFDDNTDDSSISIFEFEEAMTLVDEKIDMLYWHACLMCTIENVYQIHEYFDYIMGSLHESYTANYSILINGLLKYDNLVDMGEYYSSRVIEFWKELDEVDQNDCADLSLIDASKVENVVELIKSATDILCECRDNLVEGSEMDFYYKYLNGDSSENAESYYFSDKYSPTCPSYSYTEGGAHYFFADRFLSIDLCRSLRQFSMVFNSGELSAITTKLDDAINDMYIYNEYINLPDELYNVSVSILWVPDVIYNYTYDKYNFEYDSYSKLYPLLDFDKATGWGSNYLKANVVEAVGYNTESETYYNIY